MADTGYHGYKDQIADNDMLLAAHHVQGANNEKNKVKINELFTNQQW